MTDYDVFYGLTVLEAIPESTMTDAEFDAKTAHLAARWMDDHCGSEQWFKVMQVAAREKVTPAELLGLAAMDKPGKR